MKIPLLLLALASSTFAAAPSKPTGLGIATVRPAPSATAVRKSIVLHDGADWTIVPTDALLFVPVSASERVDAKPVGKLLPWPEFFAKNVSWIATAEVTFDQAAGNEILPAAVVAAWTAQEKLVVAVHHDGPVPVKIGPDLQAVTQR